MFLCRLRLFLISTRAGSLGVNLIAANRVVIFDACWNPSHDLQAIFRAYRYGQVKPVFVYRLLAQGTMEEKIYDRQVTKQSLSMRVVDKKQIGRHYSSSDLAELFSYTPPPPPPDTKPVKPYNRPEVCLFIYLFVCVCASSESLNISLQEDVILCKILDKIQPDWVTAYHEHDSLLEHIDDEELSEEERKAAWDLYNQQIATESAR